MLRPVRIPVSWALIAMGYGRQSRQGSLALGGPPPGEIWVSVLEDFWVPRMAAREVV